MQKIGIIGGGASGVFAAIRFKEKHPDWEVSIFERNNKLLKKIYATGNGRCNFANASSFSSSYNTDFVLDIVSSFDDKKIDAYFNSIGIATRKIDDLYYPYSLSADTVAEKLLKRIDELKIKVYLDFKFQDYKSSGNKYIVISGDKNYEFDKLVFACGGKSSPQLGTDGSIYSALTKHGYEVKEIKPSLCPIKVKENVNKINGVRAKAKVSLFDKNNKVYEEEGEIQFRSDAISGIVNFNMVFAIHKLKLQKGNISLHLDFASDVKTEIKKEEYGNYLVKKLADYLLENNLNIHNVIYTFKGLYDFKDSQVSSGGISLENITTNLESKLEKNVYLIGEVLDVDAKCGGFNLMWAWASAERVSNL